MILVELDDSEAILFREFQKHYTIVAPIAGYMSSLNLVDITNSQLTMDIDQRGKVAHMAITKHYRH